MKKILWKPSEERFNSSNIKKYMDFLHIRYNLNFDDYNSLYQWSVDDNLAFWNTFWYFSGIKGEKGEIILDKQKEFYKSRFFTDSKLNFTENLLKRRDDGDAIVFWGEDQLKKRISFKQLYEYVVRTAMALQKLGVKENDIVGGYTANTPETTIAALATASIGAIWCSCSPDFGIDGAFDRLGQVKPKVLFATNGYYYRGKTFDNTSKITEVAKKLDGLEKVVILPYAEVGLPRNLGRKVVDIYDFMYKGDISKFEFKKFEFNHPLYILFTSGTTGVPKCIVHGAGGTLIQHLKEHKLHCDIKPNDRVFYFSTCSWMMWNWHTSVLASDATLLLYDGSPLNPTPEVLFDYADAEGMTLFGTSAKYLDIIAKMGVNPSKTHNLKELRTLACTGSPLSPENYDYVYSSIKSDIHLNCFSGGTDIVSCFITGNPISDVISGEMQSIGLGMAVKVFGDDGKEMPKGKQGELVCVKNFPSQPNCFWNDAENKKFKKSYFEKYPNVWCHGDWIEITQNNGVIISGRADAVLNPGGVRIGTAEIYNQVQKIPEVLESVVVGQKWDNDERVILFVVLKDGLTLNDDIKTRIKKVIRENATPRHVPDKIIQMRAIPKTKNGKITEIAVKYVIQGKEILNKDSLENPEVLEEYKNLPELQC